MRQLVVAATCLLLCLLTILLTRKAKHVALDRFSSDDVYPGEWNLERDSKLDIGGTNPDNPGGPSWIIGMHRDGEGTPGDWARGSSQVCHFLFRRLVCEVYFA